MPNTKTPWATSSLHLHIPRSKHEHFTVIQDARALITAGNELKNAGTLVNIEALSALLYAVIAGVITIAASFVWRSKPS
mgnify:CR=1 FL=1